MSRNPSHCRCAAASGPVSTALWRGPSDMQVCVRAPTAPSVFVCCQLERGGGVWRTETSVPWAYDKGATRKWWTATRKGCFVPRKPSKVGLRVARFGFACCCLGTVSATHPGSIIKSPGEHQISRFLVTEVGLPLGCHTPFCTFWSGVRTAVSPPPLPPSNESAFNMRTRKCICILTNDRGTPTPLTIRR